MKISAATGAGFLERGLDGFAGLTGAVLNPAQQFLPSALGALQIAGSELAPLLLQYACGAVPSAFQGKDGHKSRLDW
jgi:hypothetical protein